MNPSLAFDQRMLSRVFAEVKQSHPRVRFKDMTCFRQHGDWWFCQHGRFIYTAQAHSAYHAKSQAWEKWLKEQETRNG